MQFRQEICDLVENFCLDDYEIEKVRQKRNYKTKAESAEGALPVWKSQERCFEIMKEQGIVASKFNYSND